MAFVKNRIQLIFIAAALAMVLSVHAQSTVSIDSLESAIENAPNDSTRIALLVDASERLQYSDFQKSLDFALRALTQAEKYKKPWGFHASYRQLGFLSSQSGDYSSALKYDNQNLTYAIESKDSTALAEIVNFIGNDYEALGQYDEAYYYFTRSYRIAKAIGDTKKMGIAIHNVGVVFKELGQFDIALKHFESARKLGKAANDQDGEAYMLDEMGDVYLRKGDFVKAEESLKLALGEIRNRKLNVIEPRVLSRLAKLYLNTSKYETSLAYYDSTATLHQNNDHEFGLAEAELGKANVFLALGKYKEVRELVSKSLTAAQQLHALRLETQCYDLLSRLYEKENDLKNALSYFKKFKVLSDSLNSQKTMEKLFQNQLRFETENKDSEIALLSQARAKQDTELKRQEFIRNIFVVVFALSIILLFSVYRSGQRRIRINKLLLEHQEDIKRRSLELEQLNQVKDKFFSIISHDLRSPMNALAGILDLVDRKQVTPDEFTKITKELRIQFNHTKTLINNLLDWTLLQMDKLKIQEDKINLRSLVDENFKLLSAMHLKETQMINEVPESTLAKADTNMVNLVLRNLVLNGIKFTESGGIIKVGASEKDGSYVISVADNGVGIAPEVQKILFEKTSGYSTRGTANEKGTGLGLILCKEFVEKNGGKIWLESELGKGSTFFFTLKKA